MTLKLSITENLSVKIEDTVIAAAPELMVDSGDGQIFNSAGTYFSLCSEDENGSDRRPVVQPDGVINGFLAAVAASGANDTLDIYPGSAWVAGSLVSVLQSNQLQITRPSASPVKIVSITLDSSGVVGMVDGTEGSTFSESRGSAGGPPWILVGKVELATVKLDSSTAAPLKGEEVSFAPEFSHMPSFDLVAHTASVKFAAPLPAIHTGGAKKNVWITRNEPSLIALDVISFTPPVWERQFDRSTAKVFTGNSRPGSMLINLPADQSDISRRIAGTVRLIEFMPDSTANRKEIIYAAINSSADYSPGGITTAKITLLPVERPIYQTV